MGVDKLKKESILTIVVCVLVVVSAIGIPFGYFVGKGEREVVASNCGDVVCSDCPDVNVIVVPSNTTENQTYALVIIDMAIDRGSCVRFPDVHTDDNCALPPEISINHAERQVFVYFEAEPYLVPDSFEVDFTFRNTSPFGDHAAVISADISGILEDWELINFTTLETFDVVLGIAWTDFGGVTTFGEQDPGAIGRIKPGESGMARLTVYLNEFDLPYWNYLGDGATVANSLLVNFTADGQTIETVELTIIIVWN